MREVFQLMNLSGHKIVPKESRAVRHFYRELLRHFFGGEQQIFKNNDPHGLLDD